MSLAFYMDVHIPAAITESLLARKIDVITDQQDEAGRLSDPVLLSRATELGRILFTRDEDLLTEAAGRQRRGETFAGVIYAHQLRVTIGQCVRDLELLGSCCAPSEFVNQALHLPLR